MGKKAVAFLDLLGFSNYVSRDLYSANLLLLNYHVIINHMNNKTGEEIVDDDSALAKFKKRYRTDSFDQFLPFSDSIIISANNPNLFLKQLSSFLLHCYTINSNQFVNPEVPHDPTIVTVRNQEIREQRIELIEEKENWYPMLFRGGISYNEYSEFESTAINDGQKVSFKNVTGLSMVEAVKMEKSGKGPNIYLNQNFVDELNQQSEKYILEEGSTHKLLWPAFIFIEENNLKREINHFDELFLSATNLWKAFNHEPFGIHYFKFMELIVESTLNIYEKNELEDFAQNYISEIIEEINIPEKKHVLLNKFA